MDDLEPPLWERLSEQHSGGLKNLVSGLISRFQPQKIGILYPEKERLISPSSQYQLEKELKVNNGGLRCYFAILTRL